jgi:glycosyltransferase involved in cell wall biosynthesis
MKFTVVTPLFNGMSSLRRCIGSVRQQAADAAFEVEHIVQDGESTDGGVDFLHAHLGLDTSTENYRFSSISEADSGMYDAINKGWGKAEGDILSWLNSDEQYLPGTLEKVAAYFEANPDVDAVFGDTILTTAAGRPYAARKEIPLRKWYVTNGFLYALSCSTFFRRRLWDDGMLCLDTSYRFSSDTDLILRLLDAGIKFGHIPEYFSLFGVEDGRNLSFNPNMGLETEEIQMKHGANAWKFMRKVARLSRCLERLFRGCYQPGPVTYKYALDEVPNHANMEHPRLGFRFTYEGFSKDASK